MSDENNDPKTGRGTTSDPNQADKTDYRKPEKFKDVPDESPGPKQTNTDPETGPGTTSDPNQADRTK